MAPTQSSETLRAGVRTMLTRLSHTGDLPALPATAVQALKVARDPDSSIDQLCKLIRTDVGLSARIVRVANSAAHARRTPARTLHDAIITVGLRKTCDVVIAASARQLVVRGGDSGEMLWDHALAVATAAEELAKLTRGVAPAAAFLPGLFHDVGRIVFQLVDEDSYAAVQQLAASGEGSIREVERIWYGFDHAEASAVLAQDWGLAPDQCDGIRYHHEPAQAGAGRNLALLINAADGLAYSVGFGASPYPLSPDIDLSAIGATVEDEDSFKAHVKESIVCQRELLS
jgi:putative nucleotidyltransferase with HDIG domain